MTDKTPSTPRKRGQRIPKESPSEKIAKALTVASADGDPKVLAKALAKANQTPCKWNQNISDGEHLVIIERVASGERLVDICNEMGLSSALVRKKWYDSQEWGEKSRFARMIAADQKHDEMLDVARDMSLDTARAALIVNTLEKIAKAHNRGMFGDKVAVDVRAVVIKLDDDDMGLC